MPNGCITSGPAARPGAPGRSPPRAQPNREALEPSPLSTAFAFRPALRFLGSGFDYYLICQVAPHRSPVVAGPVQSDPGWLPRMRPGEPAAGRTRETGLEPSESTGVEQGARLEPRRIGYNGRRRHGAPGDPAPEGLRSSQTGKLHPTERLSLSQSNPGERLNRSGRRERPDCWSSDQGMILLQVTRHKLSERGSK